MSMDPRPPDRVERTPLPKLDRAEPPAIVRLAVILTAFCVLWVFAASRADAAPWSGPEAVSALDADAPASEIGVDAVGDATALWTNDAVGGSVVQTAYRPAGAGWEPPLDLSGPGGEVEAADLAVNPAGDAVAVWRVTTGGSFLVQAAFRPAGGAWGSTETVPISGAAGETPQVSIDEAGDAVVVYKDGAAGIFASYRPANGSCGLGVHISPGGASAPEVAMDSAGEAVAVWKISLGPFLSVVESNTMAPGGSWGGGGGHLSLAASITEPPQVEVDAAGDFFALWASGESNNQAVEIDRMPAAGSWEAPETISTAGLEEDEPQLAVDPDGDVVAAWYRSGGSSGSIEATSLRVGGSWVPPSRLSPAGVDAKGPRIAISPTGVAQVVWTGTKEAEHHLEVSTARVQVNASWKASVTITHEGTVVFAPRIGVDHSGRTVVTWSVETSIGVVIKSSTHDERSSLDVTKSGAGAGTVTSVPARIECGSTCSGEFFEGVTVTLTATPASGSRFAGWSGACSGIGACAVEIGESQSVNAEFVPTSAGGEEAGDGGSGTGNSGTPAGGGNGGSSTGSGSTPTRRLKGAPACTVLGAPSVGTFDPTPRDGRPGLR